MRLAGLLLIVALAASAVIIDQVAVIVGNSIVKDSDIERDLRVTSFLNNDPLDLSRAARKKAADRLIDQIFIRREIFAGSYPRATKADAETQLDQLEHERFQSQAEFEAALKRYGVSRDDLISQFQWQVTVLRFIDARFKPAVLISDNEIDKYYTAHAVALRRQYPGKSADDLHEQISDILIGEKVNKEFFSWLDDQRKDSNIECLEESLK
jgi:peptidyl-prolyl cis-trans isomerase SurA